MLLAILLLKCLSLQEMTIAQPRNLTRYDMKGHERHLKQQSNSSIDFLLYQHRKDHQKEGYDAKVNVGRSILNRRLQGGRLFSVDNVLGSVKDMTSTVAKTIGDVAEALVLTPLVGLEKAINAEDYLYSLGIGISTQLVQGVEGIIGDGWKALEAVQLPGWNVAMFFPKGLVSIINMSTNTVWFLTSKAGKAIAAVRAYAIYVAVNATTAFLGVVLRILGLDCVSMPAHKYKLDNPMVDELITSTGRICGISNIRAGQNVTVTRDDESFLVVSVPFEIKDLKIFFDAVTITGITGSLIENAAMEVTVKKVETSGTLSFTSGTLIRFLSIHLHVDNMDGFDIDFPNKENGSYLMELVESIDGNLSPMVVDTINKKLDKFEKRISYRIRSMLGENTE